MYELTEFQKVIQQFLDLFDRLIPLEQKKLDSVAQNRVSALEDIIKKEQAELLAMKGLEQKRAKIQEKTGLKDLTFQEILEKLPSEQKNELKPMFDALSARVKSFRSITDSSRSIMEVNLHTIEKLIAEQTKGKGRTYSEDGSLKTGEAHFTDRRI